MTNKVHPWRKHAAVTKWKTCKGPCGERKPENVFIGNRCRGCVRESKYENRLERAFIEERNVKRHANSGVIPE